MTIRESIIFLAAALDVLIELTVDEQRGPLLFDMHVTFTSSVAMQVHTPLPNKQTTSGKCIANFFVQVINTMICM